MTRRRKKTGSSAPVSKSPAVVVNNNLQERFLKQAVHSDQQAKMMKLGQESMNRSHLDKRQSYNSRHHVEPKVAFVVGLRDDPSVDFL